MSETCYHWNSDTTEEGQTYCTKCDEILNVIHKVSASVKFASMSGSYVEDNSTVLSFSVAVQSVMGMPVTIHNVEVDFERTYSPKYWVTFSVGRDTQRIRAEVDTSSYDERAGTGIFRTEVQSVESDTLVNSEVTN